MTNKINWFEAFYKRMISSTPAFFKKIIYFGVSLGAIGLGLIALKDQLPAWIGDWAGNMVIIGIVSGVVAKAAVVDPQGIQDK